MIELVNTYNNALNVFLLLIKYMIKVIHYNIFYVLIILSIERCPKICVYS